MTQCFSRLVSKMNEIIADIVKRERIERAVILSLCLGVCIDNGITIVEEAFTVKNHFYTNQCRTCLYANLSPPFLIPVVPNTTLHLV